MRFKGFYWIILNSSSEWTIAEYDPQIDRWWIIGNEESISTKDIKEIGLSIDSGVNYA